MAGPQRERVREEEKSEEEKKREEERKKKRPRDRLARAREMAGVGAH